MDSRIPALLKFGLILSILVDLPYGVLLLVAPMLYFEIGGGTPFDPAFIRWSAGPLLGLALGAIWVLKSPQHQRIFVDQLTLAATVAALVHAYGLLMHEYSGESWLIILPLLGTAPMAVLLFLGRRQAGDLLN